jgi:hypothetical protein
MLNIKPHTMYMRLSAHSTFPDLCSHLTYFVPSQGHPLVGPLARYLHTNVQPMELLFSITFSPSVGYTDAA